MGSGLHFLGAEPFLVRATMITRNTPKKELGQHWLNDLETLTTICKLADIKPHDTIVEIGPGEGSLTDLLLKHSGRVIAVELDSDLIITLLKRFKGHTNLELINQDIRHFDFSSLPSGYKTVANIPYYLSSFLIRLLSEAKNPPSLCVLLLQKEVAERLYAQPGQLSLIGVTAQVFWEVSQGPVVPASLFIPPPKVDSQIICLKRRTNPIIPRGLTPEFFKILRISFNQKRKTLENSLSGGLGISKVNARKIIIKADIDPLKRPQALELKQWSTLTEAAMPFIPEK